MHEAALKSAEIVRARALIAEAEIGLVLGTGLGPLADDLAEAVAVPYRDLVGFPETRVSGHEGVLLTGRLGPRRIAVLRGRAHYYESGDAGLMRVPLQTLKVLGCRALLLTNAAGSVTRDMLPGALMLVTDHIDFGGRNPLIGEAGDDCFVDMTVAYDVELRRALKAAAARESIALHEGVYVWFSGPSFETPAEIRAARMLGGDVVGMSTVPEIIVARWLGLRVAAISTITNLAAGLAPTPLSHEETKAVAAGALERLRRLTQAFLEDVTP